MKFSTPKTLSEIAAMIGAEKYVGPADFPVTGINEIHSVTHGDIVFVDHPKYYDKALRSAASVVLIDKDVECPEGKALIVTDDPFRDFNKITRTFCPFVPSTAMIAPDAKIGRGTLIQLGVFIGNDVEIGQDCVLHAGVIVCDGTRIGDRVIVNPGTVIGGDAFYYKHRPQGYDRLLSSGNVVIRDDVEIGSLCTIDRGVSAPTTIGEGTKIDNHVHIGHDTVIGKECLIAAQCGIAGCNIIEDKVTIWGQVGMTSGVTIGTGAVILAQSGVSKSLEGGKTYFGYPAEEAEKLYKREAFFRLLPALLKKKGF